MPEINTNNQIKQYNGGTPLYNYAVNNSFQTPEGQTVNISSPNATIQNPIYQYPETSLYAPESSIYSNLNTNLANTNKNATSGINIYINNPSGIGGQCSTPNYSYEQPARDQQINTAVPSQPINAATNITPNETEKTKEQKTKNVVDLTDDYIKTVESYLRSDDESIRKMGIHDLIKRFEEDKSRFDDPALTALLNIALQDASPSNRLLAISPIASETAHGDENTIALLQNLSKSNKLYGQEAKLATEALLKASQVTKEIPDHSPQQTENEEES